jgi:hypothetical protein
MPALTALVRRPAACCARLLRPAAPAVRAWRPLHVDPRAAAAAAGAMCAVREVGKLCDCREGVMR